ncbi:MAG: hypothetical protein K0Q50_2428 [Vampirovibrio sp.]|jgi:hypothetical protein|nr:hypothetical protein [Vampirovibrio sp.]
MKTYRCPYCGSKDFEFQDIRSESGERSGTDSEVSVKVQVECCACHWVGTSEQLGGSH